MTCTPLWRSSRALTSTSATRWIMWRDTTSDGVGTGVWGVDGADGTEALTVYVAGEARRDWQPWQRSGERRRRQDTQRKGNRGSTTRTRRNGRGKRRWDQSSHSSPSPTSPAQSNPPSEGDGSSDGGMTSDTQDLRQDGRTSIHMDIEAWEDAKGL